MVVSSWGLYTIGQLLEFKNGLNKGKEFFGIGTPIINYVDIYSNTGIYSSDVKGMVTLTSAEIRRYEVKKGDVFFTRTSETPEEVGLACVLLEEIENCAFSGFILRGRPITDLLDINYCRYCFRMPQVRASIISECTYTTRALTNGHQLSKIKIALPPTSEQQAIASAISDMDTLVVSLENLIKKKKAIKQGAMQELLTGKKRLPGFNKQCMKIRVGDCGDFYSGLSGKIKSDFGNGDAHYITFMNVLSNVIIDIKSLEKVKVAIGERQNQVRHGDLFFNTSSETAEEVGMCAVLTENSPNTFLNSFCFGFRITTDDIDPLFFSYYFNSTQGRKIMALLAQGSTRYNLSKANFADVTIFIPEKAEQQSIVTVFSDMDREIEVLTQKLEKYRQIKQGMMQELLTGHIRLMDTASKKIKK